MVAFVLISVGCGSTTPTAAIPATEDSSTSGTVAASIGGAVNGSSGGAVGYFPSEMKSESKMCSVLNMLNPLHSAYAADPACPTILTGVSANCSVSSSTVTLTYTACSFGTSTSTWNGTQRVVFTGATPVCGTAFPTGMTNVTRTFGAGTTRTSGSGVAVTVETSGVYAATDGNVYKLPDHSADGIFIF